MKHKLSQDEATAADGSDDAQIDYEKRAKHYLKAIGKTPSPADSKEARELHSRLKTALEYLRDRQKDYRKTYSSYVMPSYEMLADTLVNLVCDMWAYVEHSSTEPEA
jgi:hypothetical protein